MAPPLPAAGRTLLAERSRQQPLHLYRRQRHFRVHRWLGPTGRRFPRPTQQLKNHRWRTARRLHPARRAHTREDRLSLQPGLRQHPLPVCMHHRIPLPGLRLRPQHWDRCHLRKERDLQRRPLRLRR